MINYYEICLKVCEISRQTGQFIALEGSKFNTSLVEQKGRHDYVSYVDRSAEAQIVNKLREILPEAGFIAEEGTASNKGEIYNWIIDPLDGTTNFVHGVPVYSISIALMENTDIVMGVVYEINLDECFYAWKNGKAMLNNKEIHVSESDNFDKALLATGFPYYDYGYLDAYLEVFKHFMQHTAGLRRLGSAAADLAYVACGRFEGFYEYGLNPWDVAAGAFIVEIAGGKVTDFNGEKNYIFGRELIAASKTIHPEILSVIKQLFKGISS